MRKLLVHSPPYALMQATYDFGLLREPLAVRYEPPTCSVSSAWCPDPLQLVQDVAVDPEPAPPPLDHFHYFTELPRELQDVIFDASSAARECRARAEHVPHLLFALTCRRFYALYSGPTFEGTALSLALSQTPHALHLLQWARSWGAVLHPDCLLGAAYRRDVPLIDYLFREQKVSPHVKRQAFDVACYTGDMELLHRLRHEDASMTVSASENAAFGGHVHVLEWLKDVWCPLSSSLTQAAAHGGHVHVLQWAVAQGQALSSALFRPAVQRGNVALVKWLLSQGVHMPNVHHIMAQAIASGSAALVSHLFGYLSPEQSHLPMVSWMQAAAHTGSEETMRFLYSHEFPLDAVCARAVARAGNLSALIWMHHTALPREQWTPQLLVHIAEYAAELGRIDMLVWLRAHCSLDYAALPQLLSKAASWARLDMIAHLRSFHVPWNGDIARMVAAAGTLSDVKRLKALGCPFDASFMAACAYHGKMQILEWGHRLGIPFDAEVCVAAAFGGRLTALKWLRAHGCPWDTRVYDVSKSKHRYVYAYALQNRCADEAKGEPLELNANVFSELQLELGDDEDEGHDSPAKLHANIFEELDLDIDEADVM